jgi:hypothetical protein
MFAVSGIKNANGALFKNLTFPAISDIQTRRYTRQSMVRSKGFNGGRQFLFRAISVTATLSWARQQLDYPVLTR